MTSVRDPLDPITRPLWRYSRADRRRLLDPFIDKHVRLERWPLRASSDPNVREYRGTLMAVATTTTGSNADLLILKTIEGNVWAISTAQVAFLDLIRARP